jgi:hypothetical protein
MTQITVDPSIQQMLGGMSTHLELRDANGQILGHFLPKDEYIKMLYASYNCDISDEELARREAESGSFTLEEIWKELGAK